MALYLLSVLVDAASRDVTQFVGLGLRRNTSLRKGALDFPAQADQSQTELPPISAEETFFAGNRALDYTTARLPVYRYPYHVFEVSVARKGCQV